MKLPAYGQRLMRARFAGWHPLVVALTVGTDWSAFSNEPFSDELACLALSPSDARDPAAIDFRCLTGSHVVVFDQAGLAGDIDGPFFSLLNKIAEVSGPLEFVTAAPIYDVPPDKPPHRVLACRYAYECKLADPERRWPWWWPESLDMKHGEKISAWCEAARSRGGTAGRRRAA